MNIEIASRQLEALGQPARLAIYRALVRAGEPGLAVGRLQERIGLAASTLTHHLHRLMDVDLVTQERRGTSLVCRANYPQMDALIAFLREECCTEAACAGDAA
jgi:DNA-binding transcriptional ArsR family regulator